MMNIELYLAYVMIITLLLLSPGPSVLLSINNGLNYSLKLALIGVLGNVLAFQILVIISATSLAALILSFSSLLLAIKIIGAVYLCFLGLKMYQSPVSQLNHKSYDKKHHKGSTVFKEAFFITSLNPKALIFVSALLPQFIDPTVTLMPQVVILCLTSAVIHFSIYVGYAALAFKAKNLLNSHKRRQVFNKVSGVIFLMFGVSIGASQLII